MGGVSTMFAITYGSTRKKARLKSAALILTKISTQPQFTANLTDGRGFLEETLT